MAAGTCSFSIVWCPHIYSILIPSDRCHSDHCRACSEASVRGRTWVDWVRVQFLLVVPLIRLLVVVVVVDVVQMLLVVCFLCLRVVLFSLWRFGLTRMSVGSESDEVVLQDLMVSALSD